jgi:NAD(P)H-dependent flavin oxidoreductase YrpB (nitropropane dioxygenase family)
MGSLQFLSKITEEIWKYQSVIARVGDVTDNNVKVIEFCSNYSPLGIMLWNAQSISHR